VEQRRGLLLVPSVGLTAVPGGLLKNPRPADFSRDACVHIEPSDRAGLERLLGHCARPAFALERTDEQRRWLTSKTKARGGHHLEAHAAGIDPAAWRRPSRRREENRGSCPRRPVALTHPLALGNAAGPPPCIYAPCLSGVQG